MDMVKLLFNNVSEILGNENIGLIVLTDELELRQITIICDKNTKIAIDMRAKEMPETQDMLPEVMARMLKAKGATDYEVLIEGVKDEQYLTVIRDTTNSDRFPVKASHAILLAIIAELPIYTTEDLMRRQSNTFNGKGKKISVPINVITDTMLEESLEKAIEEENYELASKLSKELKKRNNKENTL